MDPLDALRWESSRYGHGVRLGVGHQPGPAFAAPEHGVLVIGPPRCGKTSSVMVPNLLSACGPVVATSTKPDLLHTTSRARSRVGDCLLFDPSGLTEPPPGVRTVAWSPLHTASNWDDALLMARTMVLAARPGSGRGEAQHWTERAAALLGPAFHAAALHGMEMATLIAMIDRHEGPNLRGILSSKDTNLPLSTLEGVLHADVREQSGIWSTASSVLAAYRSETALGSSSGEPLDFAKFVRSESTLYVCAGSDDQNHAAPIVVGLLSDIRRAAYAASAAGELGYAASRPPLLFLLDEVANIAPLPDLPNVVSEGGSQGVVTVACLQDLSQARERWGQMGEGLLTLFNTKLVFPGIGDTRTLEAISLLAGDHEVRTVSVSDGSRLAGLPGLLGRHAASRTTISTRSERRLPVDVIARGAPGHALYLNGTVPAVVEARGWFDIELLRSAVEGVRPERAPPARSPWSTARTSGRSRGL
ncbi:MAG: type IV secretory system conjugative DNA transfer family protein [Acidimicrobiales bacterium]